MGRRWKIKGCVGERHDDEERQRMEASERRTEWSCTVWELQQRPRVFTSQMLDVSRAFSLVSPSPAKTNKSPVTVPEQEVPDLRLVHEDTKTRPVTEARLRTNMVAPSFVLRPERKHLLWGTGSHSLTRPISADCVSSNDRDVSLLCQGFNHDSHRQERFIKTWLDRHQNHKYKQSKHFKADQVVLNPCSVKPLPSWLNHRDTLGSFSEQTTQQNSQLVSVIDGRSRLGKVEFTTLVLLVLHLFRS